MSGHGKLSGSPFHVESPRYKYAIEHETPSVTETPVKCKYKLNSHNTCTLWNSGFDKCAAFKCPIIRKTEVTHCRSCAYYAKRKCRHPERPKGFIGNPKGQNFCGFHIGSKNNPAKYKKIHGDVMIQLLNREIQDATTGIATRHKTISRLEQTIARIEDPEIAAPYKEKLSKNKSYLTVLEQQLKTLNEERKRYAR